MRSERPDGGRQVYFGLYPAIVTDLEDPESLGRIEVRFPWLGQDGDRDVRAWATLVTPYAADEEGFQFLPDKDTQVVVGFEAGQLHRPYVVGACWNGTTAQPETPKNANDLRTIHTRSGSILEFDDTEGAAKISIITNGGHKLVLDDGGTEITLEHSAGFSIKLAASGNVEIRANGTVEVTASVMNVHAGTANFDGIVNCTTLNASAAVVSPSYTLGAGNTW